MIMLGKTRLSCFFSVILVFEAIEDDRETNYSVESDANESHSFATFCTIRRLLDTLS